MSNVIDIADALRKENPDRLFQRVWGRAAIGTSEQCWPVPVKDRYATFKLASIGRRTTTHRVAYVLTFGPFDWAKTIDHLCRNTRCLNPGHFEVVTSRVNTLRSENPAALNAVKTHCDAGHEFAAASTIQRRTGGRTCRTCQLEWQRTSVACPVCGEARTRKYLKRHCREQHGVDIVVKEVAA